MKTINIGIFAHVDAGKTSIVEQLLYQTGCTKSIGTIKHGNTQMDQMDLEKSKGITIQSSITSINWNDTKINIIDTPGHIDFVGQVYQSVLAIDLAILVVSKVDGIKAHTKMVKKVLKDKNIPFIVFVNKMDLHPNQSYNFNEFEQSLDLILDTSQSSSDGCRNKQDLSSKEILDIFNCKDTDKLMRQHKMSYLLEGSAKLGDGIIDLLNLITHLSQTISLPSLNNSPFSGIIFKINYKHNHRLIYMKILSGNLRQLQRIENSDSELLKVQKLWMLKQNQTVPTKIVNANDVACVQMAGDVRVSEILGSDRQTSLLELNSAYYQVVIEPLNTTKEKLVQTLDRFIVEDPYLSYHNVNQKITLNLFGITQLDVIIGRLLNEFMIEVTVGEVDVVKKLVVDRAITKDFIFNDKKYHLPAQISLTLSPNTEKTNTYKSSVSYGYLTKSFQQAVKDGVEASLLEGFQGIEVTNTSVELTDAFFDSVLSTPAAFRKAASILIQDILKVASFKVLKPITSFELEVPQEYISQVLINLELLHPTIHENILMNHTFQIRGEMDLEHAINYQSVITELTSGYGYFSFHFKEFI